MTDLITFIFSSTLTDHFIRYTTSAARQHKYLMSQKPLITAKVGGGPSLGAYCLEQMCYSGRRPRRCQSCQLRPEANSHGLTKTE